MRLLIDETLKKKGNTIYCTKHFASQNRIEYSLWVGDDPIWKNITPTVDALLEQKEALVSKFDVKPVLQYLKKEHVHDVTFVPHFLFHDDTIEMLKIKIKKFLRCREDEILHLWCDQQIEFTPFYSDLLTSFLFESANNSDKIKTILTCNFGNHPYPLKDFVDSHTLRPVEKKEWILNAKEQLNEKFTQTVFLGMSQYPFYWIRQNTADPFVAFSETDFTVNDQYHPHTQLHAYEHIVGNVIFVTNVATGFLPYYRPTSVVKLESSLVLEHDREFEKMMNNQQDFKQSFANFLLLDCIVNINFQEKKNPAEIDLQRIYEQIENTSEIPFKRLKRSQTDILTGYYRLGEVDDKKHQIITKENIEKWTNRKGSSDNPTGNLHGLMIKQFLINTDTERIYNTVHLYKDGKISIRIPLQQNLQRRLYEMIHLSIQNCRELILSIIQMYQLNISIFPPDSELSEKSLSVSNNVQFGNINFSVGLKTPPNTTKAQLEEMLGCGSPRLVWKQIKKASVQHFYLKRKKDFLTQSNIFLWIREFRQTLSDHAMDKLLTGQFMISSQTAKQLIAMEKTDTNKHKTRFQTPSYGVSMDVPNQEGGQFKVIVRGCDNFQSINTVLCSLQYLFSNKHVREQCVTVEEEVVVETEEVSDEIREQRRLLPKYPYNKKTTYGLLHEADKQMFSNYSDALLSGKTRKNGTKSWATTCQNGKQPIPIRDEEFVNHLVEHQKLDKENRVLQFGENQNYYICPDAWCYNCNYAFTTKEIQADIPCDNKECKIKTYKGYRCPICKTEPKGQKCSSCKYQRPENEQQLYMPEDPKLIYPGFMDPMVNQHTNETNCAVCCFKNNPKTKLQKERRDICNKVASKELIEDTQDRQKSKNEQQRSYVATSFTLENNQYGVFHKQLWELLDNPKGSLLYDKQGIRRNAPKAFLRKGLLFSQHHSFLQVFVSFYNERFPKNKVSSWKQLVNSVIIPHLTPFVLSKAKKGLLLSIFAKDHIPLTDELLDLFPKWIDENRNFVKHFEQVEQVISDVTKMVNTKKDITPIVQLLLRVYDCQQNLIAYLRDDSIHHHYRFLWELLILPEIVIPEGINLFIFEHEINSDTKEENINYICPFHSETSSFYNFQYGFFAIVLKKKDVNETFELIVNVQTNENAELRDQVLFPVSTNQVLFAKLFTKLVYGCVSYPQVNFWKSNDKEIVITKKNVNDFFTESVKDLKKYDITITLTGQLIDYFLQAYALVIQCQEENQPPQWVIFPIRRTELIENVDVFQFPSAQLKSTSKVIYESHLITFEKLSLILRVVNEKTKNIFLLTPKYKIVSHHEVNAIKLENNVILPIRPIQITHLPSAVKNLPIADIKYYLETDNVITNENVVEDERIRYMMENNYFWKTYKQLCFQLSKKLNQQDKQSVERQQQYDKILIVAGRHSKKLQQIYDLLRNDLDSLVEIQEVSKRHYMKKKIYVNCEQTTEKQCQQDNTICAIGTNACIIPIENEDDYFRLLRLISNEIVNNYWFRNEVIYHQYKPQDTEEHLIFSSTSPTTDKSRLLEEASLMQQYVQRRDAYMETVPYHDLQHYNINTHGVKISIPFVWKNALSDYLFIVENPNEGVPAQNRYVIERIFSESQVQMIGKQVVMKEIYKFYRFFPSHVQDFHPFLTATDRFQYCKTEEDFWNNFRKGDKQNVLTGIEKGTYHFTTDDLRWLSFYFGVNIIVLNFHVKTIMFNFNPTCQQYNINNGEFSQVSSPYSIIVLYDEQLQLLSLLSVIISNHRNEIRIPPQEIPVGLRLYMEKQGIFVEQWSPDLVPSPLYVTPLPSPVSSPKTSVKRTSVTMQKNKTKKVKFQEEVSKPKERPVALRIETVNEDDEFDVEDLDRLNDKRRADAYLSNFHAYKKIPTDGNNLIHAIHMALYDQTYLKSQDKEKRAQHIREQVFRDIHYSSYEQLAQVKKLDTNNKLKLLPNHKKSTIQNKNILANQDKLDPVYVLALAKHFGVNIVLFTEKNSQLSVYRYVPIYYNSDLRTIMLLVDEKTELFYPLYCYQLEFVIKERDNSDMTRIMESHVKEMARLKIQSNGVLMCGDIIVDNIKIQINNTANFCNANETLKPVVTDLNNGALDDYITYRCESSPSQTGGRKTKKRFNVKR